MTGRSDFSVDFSQNMRMLTAHTLYDWKVTGYHQVTFLLYFIDLYGPNAFYGR